jgi:ADP-ribose pyrophosphatase YjhB (NUDIX family)
MKDYLTQSQKIKVACIVRHGNKILLLRSAEVADSEHQPRGGYFDIPSFTVSFGEDPKTTLKRTLEAYVGGLVDDISMLDVRQYVTENETAQIFEVLFTAKTVDVRETDECCGKFMFVEESELDLYMFPQERTYLKKYL